MSPFERLRRRQAVRVVAQIAVVVMLAFAAVSYTQQITSADETTEVVERLLVDACAANSPAALQRENLVGACAMARKGTITPEIEQRLTDHGPDRVRDALHDDVTVPASSPTTVETADDSLTRYPAAVPGH